ncbi:MAG TPA: hypothetical protein VNQ79_02485 [Blastocatellia bacterium]|nr:hypothetical protein [Blastocatellia bacterium]
MAGMAVSGKTFQLYTGERLLQINSITLLLLSAVFLTAACNQGKSFTKDDLDKLIGERLKAGSYRTEVFKFLEEQEITSFKYQKHNSEEEAAKWESDAHIPNLYDNERLRDRWKDIRYALLATVRSSRTRFFGWDVNIWVRFYFDKDEKLIAYTLDEITESP